MQQGRLQGQAVTLRAFVKAVKTLVNAGAWSDKRMPKTGGKFPLSKAKNFRVGATGWRWRVISVAVAGKPYLVLVMYHTAKQNFVAAVGTPVGGDLLILGVLENHSTHPGWHLHAGCKDPVVADSGRMRYDGMRRVSCGTTKNLKLPFPDGDSAAFEIAARYFRLPAVPCDGTGQLNFPSRVL